MLSDAAALRLSSAQRDMLIAHIDGDVGIIRSFQAVARKALLARGLLRTPSCHTARPAFTRLTDAGRQAVAVILGDYADALVRAGMLEQSPLSVLQRLKSGNLASRERPTADIIPAEILASLPKI